MVGATFDDQSLGIVRRAYARQVLAAMGIEGDPRLEYAFATVPREHYLGKPPWRLVAPFRGGDVPRAVSDPVILYQDVNVALAPERGVNNGSPKLHAKWLHQAAVSEGDRVAHIGCGTGYYTAMLAHLVSGNGHVTAVEFDPQLAEIAKRTLAHLPNVTVVHGDGNDWPRDPVDCVYVSFSVQRPAGRWLDGLAPGGRLVFPLGVPGRGQAAIGGLHAIRGAGLRIERRGETFAARWLGPAFFVCAEGALTADLAERASLIEAFERGGVEFVRSLHWRRPSILGRSWYYASDWGLGYDEAS